jgi:hypothetical protein
MASEEKAENRSNNIIERRMSNNHKDNETTSLETHKFAHDKGALERVRSSRLLQP